MSFKKSSIWKVAISLSSRKCTFPLKWVSTPGLESVELAVTPKFTDRSLFHFSVRPQNPPLKSPNQTGQRIQLQF